jgi:hypothetical protein
LPVCVSAPHSLSSLPEWLHNSSRPRTLKQGAWGLYRRCHRRIAVLPHLNSRVRSGTASLSPQLLTYFVRA